MRLFLRGRPTARLVALALLVGATGCATRSPDIAATPFDAQHYLGWRCDQLDDEADAVQSRAADVAYDVDVRSGNNLVVMGVGFTVFWPALIAMRSNGEESAELAVLRGRYDAVQAARRAGRCPPVNDVPSGARAANLPVTLGERWVYSERTGPRGAEVELGLRLSALHRDGLAFEVDRDGRRLPVGWRQDWAGNTLGPAADGLLLWRRLLRPGLSLGDTVAGDVLRVGDDAGDAAHLHGQVVAVGPQTVSGRRLDLAVIELFGDVPHGPNDLSTRVEGVMDVDRASGLLVRLELRSGRADFSVRRRLVRIETPVAKAP